jgi:protein phosphatase
VSTAPAPVAHVRLEIPTPSLVLLVGPSGCGKSTFARTHFGAYETVSSDRCRALVSNDEADQSATKAAFEVLHLVVAKRLERGLLTVVDATNVSADARRSLLDLARRYHLPSAAIVLDLPEAACVARNVARTERTVAAEVIHHQREQLHRTLRHLPHEGFQVVHVLASADAVDAAAIERVPLPVDRRAERGPFDVIGDVHGCGDELEELLTMLGYARGADGVYRHPARRVVFVGDLVDRGPRIVDVLRIAMAMVDAGSALAVPGNHDAKLARKLRGRNVQVSHGLAESLAELDREPSAFVARVADFIESLPSHLVLDDGALVVAHAGMKASLQRRDSSRVRDFALYGETTGETDQYGLPVRLDWAATYHGSAFVVYGHTPVAAPRWMQRTVNIDTGCVFGGALTALRWPELEVVSVPARREYAPSRRPFLPRHFVEREEV